MKHAVLTFYFFITIIPSSLAQNRKSVDSLLKRLETEKSPVKKVKLLMSLGSEFVFTNADSAILFHKQALAIARQLNSDSLIAQTAYQIAGIEATRNYAEPALRYADTAFYYWEKTGNTLQLAMVRNVQGGIYMSSGKNELASRMFFEAINYTKEDTATARILFTYHNLVILLRNMDKKEKALEYAFKQYHWAKRINVADEVAYACSNVIDTYAELKDTMKALRYIDEFIVAIRQTQDPYLHVFGKIYLGIKHYVKGDFKQAVDYFLQALRMNENLTDQEQVCMALFSLGEVYERMKLYEKADSCFLRIIDISYEIDIKRHRAGAYEKLTETALARKDFENAFTYLKARREIQDTLLNEKTEAALIDAESKYQLDEREKEIKLLNTEKALQAANTSSQKTQKLVILFAAIGLLAMIGLLFNRYKLKRKVEQQAMVLNERTRISHELHDDLGGELSTIRLLSEMAQMANAKNPELQFSKISASSAELVQKLNEIVWALNVANDTLQSLISYMHRYSVKYLDDVGINCHFTQPNTIPALEIDGAVRRNIFLLVKEALNNIVKHAAASCVTITVETDSHLRITIQDNGRGIATEKLTAGSGNGLFTMQKRAKDLNGTMQIANEAGTNVTFEIPLAQTHTKV